MSFETQQVHQATLAAIIESSDNTFISADLKSLLTSWNRAAERMSGYTARNDWVRTLFHYSP
ncbi:PAS domain S-box protein [Panacibacter sp. DH6]|uniref:PAS domain S-box protein n=1 Tax=Panacibacter microcysteis TaxID=2793269 RepID=A0A931MF86_9BACT|nr:PAS domain S-box protein [Panacibacter microcysteis]MBG9378759.1 PAS domain S-box protein [Panacibacter microcysteis]